MLAWGDGSGKKKPKNDREILDELPPHIRHLVSSGFYEQIGYNRRCNGPLLSDKDLLYIASREDQFFHCDSLQESIDRLAFIPLKVPDVLAQIERETSSIDRVGKLTSFLSKLSFMYVDSSPGRLLIPSLGYGDILLGPELDSRQVECIHKGFDVGINRRGELDPDAFRDLYKATSGFFEGFLRILWNDPMHRACELLEEHSDCQDRDPAFKFDSMSRAYVEILYSIGGCTGTRSGRNLITVPEEVLWLTDRILEKGIKPDPIACAIVSTMTSSEYSRYLSSSLFAGFMFPLHVRTAANDGLMRAHTHQGPQYTTHRGIPCCVIPAGIREEISRNLDIVFASLPQARTKDPAFICSEPIIRVSLCAEAGGST